MLHCLQSHAVSVFVPQCMAFSQSRVREPFVCFFSGSSISCRTRVKRWHAYLWCCGSWYPMLPTETDILILNLWVTFISQSSRCDGLSLHLSWGLSHYLLSCSTSNMWEPWMNLQASEHLAKEVWSIHDYIHDWQNLAGNDFSFHALLQLPGF